MCFTQTQNLINNKIKKNNPLKQPLAPLNRLNILFKIIRIIVKNTKKPKKL